MPIDILPGTAPHAEEFLISYLHQFFTNVRTEMPNDPPFPFYLINRIAGGDDLVSDYAVVSVHSFHTKRGLASDAADAVHAKMKALTAKTSVTVRDRTVGVEFMEVVESPIWVDYNDPNIKRYVGRYRFGLRLT